MRTYVVNLQTSVHRRKFMQEQFEHFKVDEYSFFPAVDGRTIIDQEGCSEKWRLFKKGYPFTPGEKGCFLSHRRLWALAVKEKSAIAVLEDDVSLKESYSDLLARLKPVINKLGLVRLGHQVAKHERPRSNGFYRYHRVLGTWGYVISPAAAKKLLVASASWSDPVDDFMDQVWRHGVYSWGVTDPAVTVADLEFHSDIGDRQKPKLTVWVKVRQELCRVYYQLRSLLYRSLKRFTW